MKWSWAYQAKGSQIAFFPAATSKGSTTPHLSHYSINFYGFFRMASQHFSVYGEITKKDIVEWNFGQRRWTWTELVVEMWSTSYKCVKNGQSALC